MVPTSLSETQNSVDLGSLARNSIFILSLQAVGVVLTYLAQVFLARWMGRTEYGIYEYAIAWSLVLAIPVSLGLPRAVLRFISEYRVQQAWGELRGLLLSSWQLTAGVGLLLSLASIEIIDLLNRQGGLLYAPVLLAGVWLIPLQALTQLQEDMARGADDIALAYGPSKVLWPLLILGGGFLFFQHEQGLSSVPMIRIASVSLLVVIVFQVLFLWFKFNGELSIASPTYKPRQWLRVALPLMFNRAFEMLLQQIDVLMLGALVGATSAGVYTAAAKTAMWTSFVLQSLNFVAAPAYSILHTQGDREGLQKVVAAVTLWIFAPSLVIAFTLFVFAQPILSVFGADFVAAQWPLRVLVIGLFIDVLCGSVSNLMIMTGNQNKLLLGSASSALINFILNAILIPKYGMVGAAIATSATLVIWDVWLCILVVRNLEINPLIVYSFSNWLSRK